MDSAAARIGPNAILQMLPVLDRAGGVDLRDRLLAQAGIAELPDGSGMIPEGPAARLHQALRQVLPDAAPALARDAGLGTADYILAHRIPRPAQRLLRVLPRPLAMRALSTAIARHAWTFAGSGRFRVLRPGVFEIADNPIIRGERSDVPLCHWHAAVFERLFRVLVDDRLRCVETRCGAMGDDACRFEVVRNGMRH